MIYNSKKSKFSLSTKRQVAGYYVFKLGFVPITEEERAGP
jgi:hypothetical protein